MRPNSFATLIGLLAWAASAWGQQPTTDEGAFAESWQIPAGTASFKRLWSRMDSVERGHDVGLSVLYIGGSHVQAGWIGHSLRNALHEWAPHLIQSRGMQLPYRIARTNTPTHFRTEFEGTWDGYRCTRGAGKFICSQAPLATGIEVHPHGPCRIQHVSYFPDSSRAATDALEIWTNAPETLWQWDGNAPLNRVDALGNGLGWRLTLESPADTLAIRFDVPDESDIWYAGMNALARSSATLTVHEWGHNGCRIAHAANAQGWEALLEQLDPDLILIGIGLNDAVQGADLNPEAFAGHYTPWVQRIGSTGAAVVLLGNTPARHDGRSLDGPNAQLDAFLQACGTSQGMGYMNLSKAMTTHAPWESWASNGWTQSDGLHFTALGYAEIAGLIYQAWITAYAAGKKNASLGSEARAE